jgi:ribosomal protein L19
MKNFYNKINNNHPSISKIEKIFISRFNIKNSKNFILNERYIDLNIRRNKLINFNFLIQTNELNKFRLNGIIKRKKKKNSINNSITARSLLSGIHIEVIFNLYSPGIRLI